MAKRQRSSRKKRPKQRSTAFHPSSSSVAANLFQKALQLHQQGELQEAEALYRQILALRPDEPEVFHYLGILCNQKGKAAEAVDLLERAARLSRNNAKIYCNLGLALTNCARFSEAIRALDKALVIEPDMVEALINLANAWAGQGNPDKAESFYRRVLELDPAHVPALCNLGNLLLDTGRVPEAVQCFERALQTDKRNPLARYNLGRGLVLQGEMDKACACFEQTLDAAPHFVQARLALVHVFMQQQRMDRAVAACEQALKQQPELVDAMIVLGQCMRALDRAEDALTWYRNGLDLQPENALVHYNLGNLLNALKNPEAAMAHLHEALRLNPDLTDARVCLGTSLLCKGEVEQAISCFQKALESDPAHTQARINLGQALERAGRAQEAVACYCQVLRAAPGHAQAHSNMLLCLNYTSESSAEVLFEEHVKWDQQHAAPLMPAFQDFPNLPDPDRQLRIGYVSPDFCQHSVHHFIEPLLVAHDRSVVEVFAYANVRQPDAVTGRLRTKVDVWQDIARLSDAEADQLIRSDRIDVLIDLAGHTTGNRLLVFARRPAPVQITYLGYPDTTGMQTMDARFTDPWADPEGEAAIYDSESLVRLPHGFHCYQPVPRAPRANALPAAETGQVTFASFNNLAKLSGTCLNLWAKLVHAVPGSRLLLKGEAMACEGTRKRFESAFAARGIARGRLMLRPFVPSVREHLAAYHEADIALDTYPYHGTTTTLEALWMGVPVVTLAGEIHAARVGASLLTQAGLDHCIASTPEQFVEIATALAQDLDSLAKLRQVLRTRLRASSLMDAPRLARDIEHAIRSLWKQYCETSGAA